MNIMKRQLKIFLSLAVATVFSMVVSCGPAEGGYTEEAYFDDIFTVNKSTLQPEFSDTSFMVSNVLNYGLNTGDRAHLVLHYYWDAYSGVKPEYKIHEVVEVIPTREVSAMDSTVLAEYNTLMKLDYYELDDRYYKPVWVWNNLQNINVVYNGYFDSVDFKLMLRGVLASEEAIEFDLVAKSAYTTNVESTKLLTFDLTKVGSMLSPAQKNSLASCDSVKTKIYCKSKNSEGEIVTESFTGGKLKNIFR